MNKMGQQIKLIDILLNEIHSTTPHTQKTHLNTFIKTYLYDVNEPNNKNCNNLNYHQNYYNSNNVQISGTADCKTNTTGTIGIFF